MEQGEARYGGRAGDKKALERKTAALRTRR
jgi:hypothetical protein